MPLFSFWRRHFKKEGPPAPLGPPGHRARPEVASHDPPERPPLVEPTLPEGLPLVEPTGTGGPPPVSTAPAEALPVAPPAAPFPLTRTIAFDDAPPPTALVPLSATIVFDSALAPPAGHDEPPRRPRVRILIVDDDAATVALVRHRLLREGFEVDDCPEGDDALRRVFDEPYDLVLANTLLAGLDGFGILRHMRAAGLSVPVVLMGHHGDEQAVVRAFALGAHDFIPKPFSPIELLARLVRVLALPRAS